MLVRSMKKTIFFILFCGTTQAGQVDITFSPNGPGCNHVSIRDVATGESFSTTREELISPISDADQGLIMQIKAYIKDIPVKDDVSIETVIETKDVDFPAKKTEVVVVE